jgi:hypothetical protein
MQRITSTSPDNQHSAFLDYSGEIRFGPAFYTLKVDTISFGKRVFGNRFLWSPDSRYFAIQEWQTVSEALGPQTQLLFIDLETKSECVFSKVEQGFIVPKKFENGKLIYAKEYYGRGVAKEFEIDFPLLATWEDIK